MTRKLRAVPAPAADEKECRARLFTERLVAFGRRHDLAPRRLARVLGSAVMSKSSADRFYRGEAVFRFVERHRPAIIAAVTEFLAGLGRTQEEIREELLTIFTAEEIAPMIAARTELPLPAQRHFGLRRDPFTRPPRGAEEAFTYPALDAVFERVLDAVQYQGFLAVLGDIGSGKTLLKIRVNEAARRSGGKLEIVWPRFAVMNRVDAGAIVASVLEHFEQRPRRGLVAQQRQLERLLSHLNEQGRSVALGFDECHRLHDTTLSALKNFYELSMGYDQFLGVVLFGQPHFRGRMQSYDFREIAERLEIVEMPGFGKLVGDYVAHRLSAAGGSADRLFEKAAVARIAAQADTPLAVGNLANAALLRAYNHGLGKVTAELVKQADDGEPRVRSIRRAAS